MSMANFSDFYKKQNCQACTFKEHGVKTRKHIFHTCGIKEGFVPKNVDNRDEEAKRMGYMIEPKCPDLLIFLKEKEQTLKHIGSTYTNHYLGVHFMVKGVEKPRMFISMAFEIDDQSTPISMNIDNKDLSFKEEVIDIFIKYLSEISTFYYLKDMLKYETYLEVPEEIFKKANNYKNFNSKVYKNLLKKIII